MAESPVTVPALCAVTGFSIFIASSTTTRSPAATVSPSDTATLTIVPCIGAFTASPDAAALPEPPPRRRGAAFSAAGAATPPKSAGSVTSSRLPPTSTTTDCRSGSSSVSAPSSNGSTVLSHSVSIHRVCTVKSVVNAGSSTTSRWNGSTVAVPSTWNSASARRDRSNACARSEPVTISLASNESNCPPITEPASTPASTRTPGPDGSVSAVIVPGDGKKFRPASSPLMRNSMECPRGVGSSVNGQRLALGDAELLAHEVDARRLLRHRVLHLQPGVDLEERDQPVLADEELDRARPVVARLPADRLGGLVDRRALLVGEERRGRLLDELLETPLQGAVAGADDDHAAVRVRQHLGLDVAGLVQVALHEALAAPERGLRLPHGRLVQPRDLLLLARDLEPAAAAAERGLDRDREAVLLRERHDLVRRRTPGRWCRARAGRPRAWRCGGR